MRGGTQSGKDLSQIDNLVLSYPFLGKTDIESSNTVITGTIYFCDRMAYVLFEPISTYSYVSVQFVMGMNLVCDVLDYLFICLLWLVSIW